MSHERFGAIEGRLMRIEGKIDALTSFQDRQRGAISVLMALAGAIGAGIAAAVRWLFTRP